MLLGCVLFAGTGLTQVLAAEEAAFKKYSRIVDVTAVEKAAVIPMREDIMIIDSRPTARKYDKGHIPTAVNIPFRQFEQFKNLLPEDKKMPLIFYCGGLKCPLSHKSAFLVEEMGYKDISVFAEGYPAWLAAGQYGSVSSAYVKKVVDGKNKAVIVDARPARKFKKGAVPNSINIPFRDFDKHLAQLPEDKATALIFYCGGFKCSLSVKSATKATELGYTNVRLYQAGYPAWKKAYGDVPAASAVEAGGEEGTITVASFDRIMKQNPDSILVVDVRDPPEFKAGAFKGSVNIPIDDLEKKVDTLPKDKPIVFVCNSGGLAGEAYDIVKMLRDDLKIYFLEAELSHNQDGSYSLKAISG
jgi:rhodanese-related sulfurtransferase